MKNKTTNKKMVAMLTLLLLLLSNEGRSQTGTYQVCKGTAAWNANRHIYENFNFMMENYALNINCDCWYLKGVNHSYYREGFYKFRTNGITHTFRYFNKKWYKNNQISSNPFVSGY